MKYNKMKPYLKRIMSFVCLFAVGEIDNCLLEVIYFFFRNLP